MSGRTPALACAPNKDVAECLALILSTMKPFPIKDVSVFKHCSIAANHHPLPNGYAKERQGTVGLDSWDTHMHTHAKLSYTSRYTVPSIYPTTMLKSQECTTVCVWGYILINIAVHMQILAHFSPQHCVDERMMGSVYVSTNTTILKLQPSLAGVSNTFSE